MQEGKQIGTEGRPYRIPATEDGDRKGDPADPVQAGLGPHPACFYIEREGWSGKADECPSNDGIDITQPVDVGTAYIGCRRAFADAAQHQPGSGAKDPQPGQDDEQITDVGHQVLLEEQSSQNGYILQKRNGQAVQDRAGNVHVGNTEEVGQVASGQRQHEPHGHLRLVQGNAAEGDQQGYQRSDDHPGQESKRQTSCPVGDGETAHGGEQDRAIHGQVDDPGTFGDGLTDHSKQHRGSRCQDSSQTDQDHIRIHSGSYTFLKKRCRAPSPSSTSSTSKSCSTPAKEESSLYWICSCTLPMFRAAKMNAIGAAHNA